MADESWQASLLPGKNATPLETAVSLANAARYPLPAHLLKTIDDPLTVPEHLIAYTAWHYSVDLWDEGWPLEKKRAAIVRQIALARIKGTQAAVEGYVDLAGSSAIEFKTPPQKSFLARRRTKEEIEAYLAKLPSIRVYVARKQGRVRGGLYLGHGAVGRSPVQFDLGPGLYGRRAALNVAGVETPLTVFGLNTNTEQRSALTTERIALPGKVGRGLVLGRGAIGQHGLDSVELHARTITHVQSDVFDHRTSELWYSAFVPGFEPINPRYERVSDKGHVARRAFCGTAIGKSFLGRDRSRELIHDRLRWFDPAITAPLPQGRSFLGHARLGMKPFTAEVMIKTDKPAQKGRVYLGYAALGRKAVGRDDLRLQQLALQAVVIAKEHHSKVLVTFQTTRRITFGDAVPMDGTYRFNSRVRAHL